MIKVLKEHGYEEARLGLGLSYGLSNNKEDGAANNFKRLEQVARKISNKGNGENKFLESIVVWLHIEAPRYIWQEFDTYRVGVTKQSSSTMHTLKKTAISMGLFDEMELQDNSDDFEEIKLFEKIHKRGNLHDIKIALPEGFLQGRIVCTNYKTIQNIYKQRYNHRLGWWKDNLEELLQQLQHPELINAIGDYGSK